MATSRVSPKYQIVIPKEIREGMSLRPGQDVQVLRKGNVIVIVPNRPMATYRGVLRGLRATGYREKDIPRSRRSASTSAP